MLLLLLLLKDLKMVTVAVAVTDDVKSGLTLAPLTGLMSRLSPLGWMVSDDHVRLLDRWGYLGFGWRLGNGRQPTVQAPIVPLLQVFLHPLLGLTQRT